MFSNFNFEARKVMLLAKLEMKALKHPYVGSEHLLLAILKHKNNVSKKLKELNFTYEIMHEEIVKNIGIGSKESPWYLYTPLLKRILENAIIDSKENNSSEVTIEHLFTAILEEGEGIAVRIMLGLNIDIDELYQDFSYKFVNSKKRKKNKKLTLDDFGIDLNKKALNGEIDPVIGRDKEIKRILEILSRRTKNNPILIGEAGVGKTAIVEELSRMIINNKAPLFLKNKKIISLDMASLVAGTKYRGEFEERIGKLLKEVEENDEIILFIDEIHTIVGAGGAEGAIDAANIFKPALARNKLRCIGATTTDEYKKYIEKDSALERRFQKVIIDIPNKEEVKNILMNIKGIYESYHSVSISEKVIDVIIELSDKYIYDRNQPDASIDILDEVCAKVHLKENKYLKKYNDMKQEYQKIVNKKYDCIKKNKFNEASIYKDEENKIMNDINEIELNMYKKKSLDVLERDVAEVISIKTHVPVYELLKDNYASIKKLENNLKTNIIGQDKAINEIINISKKIKLGFKDNKCYSFLFIGPSGVGKTELAKVFGENMFGNKNVIRLDMSEYSESHCVSKIIGSPPGYVGYDDNHNILEDIRLNPYSILILDEIEKASESILNLFFQILDEGKIKNSSGKIVRFDNVIIIMTSNIGYNEIQVGFNKENTKISKLHEYYGTPLINRIDNIISFNNLDEQNILELIDKKIKKLKEKYLKKDVNIKISKKVYKEIIELSNYKDYGARKIDKIIKDKIDNIVIDNIINNNYKISINTILNKVIV